MQRLLLAARPPVPFHDASSSSFPVARGKAVCCAGSLKQECPDRAAHLAVAATAVTGRAAAPFLAAVLLLAAAPSGLPASIPPAFAQPASEGAALFRKACIGCHDMGGNILQPGATLFLKDLERNGVATEEELYNITYYGKGRMPGFGEKCTPRGQCTFGPRLSDDDIKLLASFVKSQAENGWPKIEGDGD
ncbi:hypothetical protein PR202_ga29517 [Eleusine coracana subsp. coracana]|uniref:Cytochrome c-553 n=1 Tax=Eleusine coracana subsp. coracana TaxID=191504 RepID=A0AAV5DL10_ELECO|nr:hypothetical protein PR202_ga29517 [Eleusine coracana subsp. coracana]